MVHRVSHLAAIFFVGQCLAGNFLELYGPREETEAKVELCAESGCLEAAFIGSTCAQASTGDVNDGDRRDDSSANVKKVRDCICRSDDFWSRTAQ